ncbi:hypothetical protein A2Y83_00250 [Candidatus Falkowbacteria bacterium RBG_13_39_14]|uniref:Aminotransferase n=1 Tax=Candidatus Falkowbacteria bacterium RBG_13_39_14 TaxID=1797985 RepID=A0A1F5S453_9BACT|nr:MAG: hypothetical protein A2Y83_00250 [Candidatus Falkowbacteria bacterium RBG_13_39_14]
MISNNAINLSESPLYSFFNEVKKREANGERIINLGVGLPYHDTPLDVKEAGIKAVKEGKTKYTPASGVFELKKAIAEKFKKEGLNYDTAEIVISSGAKPLLAAAEWAVIDPGDKVIISSPYYPPFVEVAKQMGAEVVLADGLACSSPDKGMAGGVLGDFGITTPNPPWQGGKALKLLIFNSPNNPIGKVYNKEELEEIAKFAKDNDLWVISDECYSDFVYGGNYLSIASLPDMKERTIVIRSFSKSYAMTGWRVGYAAGSVDVIKKISMYLDNFIGCASSISQYAALAALKDDGFTEKMRGELDENRKILIEWLDKKGIEYVYPEGAFYVFVKYANLRELDPSDEHGARSESMRIGSVAFAMELLERGIAVTPGVAFGDYDDYIRISYSVGKKKLEEALGKISKLS